MSTTDREPSALDGARVALLILAGLAGVGGLVGAGVLLARSELVAAAAVAGVTVTQGVVLIALALVAGEVAEIRHAVAPVERRAVPAAAGHGLYGRKA